MPARSFDDPPVLDASALSEVAQAALTLASSELRGGEPLQTAGVLSALARVDVRGEWERLWLVTSAFDFLDRATAFRDAPVTAGGSTASYEGHLLSPATELALRRVQAMASAYGMAPTPPGALALALVADPESGAAKALLARGEITHGELLTFVQSELLRAQLSSFDEFLDETRELRRTNADVATDTIDSDVSPGDLMRLVLGFAATPDLRLARQLVEENERVLLSPMADAALEMQLTIGRRAGHDEMVAAVEGRRELLRRCRTIGIDRAFAEEGAATGPFDQVEVSAESREIATLLLEFVTARSWPASKRVLRAHEDTLLSDQADLALGVFIDRAESTGDDAADVLRRHRKLLRRCREIGIDAAFAEIDGSRPEDDETSPIQLVRQFATAPTTQEAVDLIRAHPELVDPAAIEQLEALVEFATKDGNQSAAQGLQERLDLLSRCAELGLDAALDESHGGAPDDVEPGRLMALLTQFGAMPGLRDARRLVEDNPVLRTQAADAAMEVMLDLAGQTATTEIVDQIKARRHLLRRCRTVGVERAFEEARSSVGPDSDDTGHYTQDKSRLAATIMEFVMAPSWEASKRVLVTHDELMSDAADNAFDVFISGAETAGDGAAEMLRTHQILLRRCREIGVDAAFQELDEPSAPSDPPLRQLLSQFVTAPTLAESTRQLERYPRLVSSDVVKILAKSVEALKEQGSTDLAGKVEEKLELLRQCVDIGVVAAVRGHGGGVPDERELLELLARAMDSGSGAESAEILREHPELLWAETDDAVDALIATARSHRNIDMVAKLEKVKSFTAQSRALRRASDADPGSSRIGPEEAAILPVMFEFYRADSWAESRRIVEDHPELLGDAADRLIARMVRAAELQDDGAAAESVGTYRKVLRRAREVGVPQAFDEVGRGDEPASVAEIMAMLREAQVEMDELGAPPEVRVSVLGQAATMLMERHRQSGGADAIDAAIEC